MPYRLIKKEGAARRGEFQTVHGTVQTPAFQNVATAAAIKGGLSAHDLKEIRAQVMLCNTYHLHLRPGDQVVADMGGLHKFTRWDGPILTDSGGFQVFSLAKLTNLLATASKGRYEKEKAIQIREAARTSIGSVMSAKSLELKHTIKLIKELTSEIDEIEDSIQQIMDELHPPILSIPGMGVHSAAMILAEIGDFSNFDSPDKVLAYAGCSPSTYQSGKLTNCYAHMEKRGSRYLRYALYNATKYVCHWNPVFAEYLAKKRSEGKHYNVALSHAMKKLVRLIYALQKSGNAYLTAA